MTNNTKFKLFMDNEKFLKKHPDSQFSRLSISIDPDEIKKREIIETWFSKFPDDEKHKFKSRFKSKTPGGIASPFFELVIHQLLLELGFTQIEYEPKIKCKNTREEKANEKIICPDFFIKFKAGYALDALLISSTSEQERKRHKVRMTTNENLESVLPDDVCVIPEYKITPDRPISKFLLKKEIDKYFITRDNKSVNNELTMDFDDFELVLTVYERGKTDSKVEGIFEAIFDFDEFTYINSIKEKIRKKAKKIRKVELPFLLAVDLDGFYLLSYVEKALFGGYIEGSQKSIEGLWGSETENHYSNLIGVIAVHQFFISTMFSEKAVQLVYYSNPFQENEIHGQFSRLMNGCLNGTKVIYRSGESIQSVLRILP